MNPISPKIILIAVGVGILLVAIGFLWGRSTGRLTGYLEGYKKFIDSNNE